MPRYLKILSIMPDDEAGDNYADFRFQVCQSFLKVVLVIP